MGSTLSSAIRLPAWIFALALLSACSSARVSQFDSFAAAGIKYADAVPLVFDQAFEAAVRTDSLVLSEIRPDLSQELARIDAIEKSNENLVRRLAIFNSLKAHLAGLRAYFVALKALAASDADSGITQATKDVAGTLGKINSGLANVTLGKVSLNGFLDQAVPIAVAQFRSAALKRELAERAGAIERELNLQQAALSAVAASMKADLETQSSVEDRDGIVRPYASDRPLPNDWAEKRLESFRRRLDTTAVDAATNAAKTLRLSYIALAEDRLDASGISMLLGDVDKMVVLLESSKGKPAPR